jgi:hypothetical protein
VIQDRSLFLTAWFMADLFAGFSDSPHTYDMAWHFRGRVVTSLDLQPKKFDEPVANGYNALGDVESAGTDQPWSAAVASQGGPCRLLAPGGTATEVIVGSGHFFTKSAKEDEFPPTVIERRAGQGSALFGNVIDISGNSEGFVQGVTQEGGLAAGYGLLRIETTDGEDLCFSSYRPAQYTSGDMETDALQAMVLRNRNSVLAMYLAGGTSLRVGGALIERNDPGLAYFESFRNGGIVVGNPSPTAAIVSLSLPGLAERNGFVLDSDGQLGEPAIVATRTMPDSITLRLEAGARVEFVPR